MDNIQELFALPIGLKPVAKLDDIELYGSQTLNDKFIQAISSSRRTKKLSEEIKKMVDRNIIIPCFADPGVISYFRRRISRDSSGGLMRILKLIVFASEPINNPLDHVLAFYSFTHNNIIVLISNHIQSDKAFRVEVVDSAISISLVHEMMHMYAHMQPNKFINLFKDELILYYDNVFTKIFNLNNDKMKKIVIEEYFKFLFFQVEMRTPISVIPIPEILKILNKFKKFSKYDEDKFENVKMDYIKLTRLLYNQDLQKVVGILKKNFKYIIVPLYDSYKQSFGRSSVKGCTQEVYFPSEVICGYTEIKFDSKVIDALKSIV